VCSTTQQQHGLTAFAAHGAVALDGLTIIASTLPANLAMDGDTCRCDRMVCVEAVILQKYVCQSAALDKAWHCLQVLNQLPALISLKLLDAERVMPPSVSLESLRLLAEVCFLCQLSCLLHA
jgi:hypothetical protein